MVYTGEVLEALRRDWLNPDTSDERRVEIVAEMRKASIERGMRQTCRFCKKVVVYLDDIDHAVAEGHIYSHDGYSEFGITHMCEFCFDKAFNHLDDAEDEAVYSDDLGFFA